MVIKLVNVLGVAVNWSVARTVRSAVLGRHGFNGSQLPWKEETWPKARLVGNKTAKVPRSLILVTVTPTKVLLPQLVTVPVKVMRPFSPTLPTHCAVIRTQGRLTWVLTPWLPPPLLLTSFWWISPWSTAVARTVPSDLTS